MPLKTSVYDDPNKLLPKNEATKTVFENYWRSKHLLVDPKRDQWKEWYKAYRSVVELKDDSLRTKLVVPLIFTTVEDFLPRLVANRPNIEVWGRGREDEVRAAQHRALLFYDWDILNMAYKIIEFVKSAEIYGTAWIKIVHRKKEETRLIRQVQESPRNVLGIQVGTTREIVFTDKSVVTWNDPWVDVREIDQIFPDPDGKDVETCSYIIDRIPTTLHELKAARKDNKPLYDEKVLSELEDLLKEQNSKSQDSGVTTIREMVREEFDLSSQRGAPDTHKREIHILEQWSDSKITTVVEEFPQLDPIRHEFNEGGSKPFIRYTPIPDPNNIYGLSLPEVLMSLQFELSTIHSARVDNLLFSVHQMFKILRNSGINPRNLRFRPGGHIWVKDMGDIEPLATKFTDFSLYRESDEARRWGQKVGATDTFSGIASDLTGRTATEATILAEASGSRASLMFRILGEQALRPLGRHLIKINELYLDEERFIRIAGDDFGGVEFQRITPEELLSGSGKDLDVVIDIAQVEPQNRAAKLQRAKDAMGTLAQLGLPPNHPVTEYFLTDLLAGFGHPNPQALVTSDRARVISGLAGQQGKGATTESAVSNVQGLGEALAAELGANAQ